MLKNIKKLIKKTLEIAIIILGILSIDLSKAEANSHKFELSEDFVNACIIASPFLTAGQILGALNPVNKNPFKTAKNLHNLLQLLRAHVITPADCRRAVPAAEIALNRYMFRKDLGNCLPLSELAGRTTVDLIEFDGKWFCETLSFEDWEKFRDWKQSKNADLSNEEIDNTPIFSIGPIFDISKYTNHPDTSAFRECNTIASQQNAAALRRCFYEETARHDIVLNAAYQCLKQTLTSEAFTVLRDRQRQWISDRKAECAYSDTEGTIAHDLRAGCNMEKTKNKAFELAALARRHDCTIPSAENIAPDLDKWINTDGNPSVSNASGYSMKLSCDGSGWGHIQATNLKLPEFDLRDLRDRLNFSFLNGQGKQLSLIGLYSDIEENRINFELTDFVIKNLMKATTVKITDGVREIEFSLRGSSKAVKDCNTTNPVQKQPPSNTPSAAHSTQYTESENGVYITLPGDLPIRIRCDRAFPEAYIRPNSFLTSIFGGGISIGDTWSFEVTSRSGKSRVQMTIQAEDLSDGVGFRLNADFLWSSLKSAHLYISNSGKEYSSAISAQTNDLKACHRTSYHELNKFILGIWSPTNAPNISMTFSSNLVSTIMSSTNFWGWGTVESRAFFFKGNDGKENSLLWQLSPNGKLHIAPNAIICGLKRYGDNIILTNSFDCSLRGIWQRKN